MEYQCLHSGYNHKILRQWHNQSLSKDQLIYPVFVSELENEKTPINALKNQFRYGYTNLPQEIEPLVQKGLRAVLVFGVLTDPALKDNEGSQAYHPNGPTQQAVRSLRQKYSRDELLIITDCCLCAFTSHGNCGVHKKDKYMNDQVVLDNDESCKLMAKIAESQAVSGADVIAPSDMMDGRIKAIRELFIANKTQKTIMSYASKFTSSFYGPFRAVCDSAPSLGHRADYQLPIGSSDLALKAAIKDYKEGSDFLIVKPATMYLDIVQKIKQCPDILCQIAVYQVSGEYAMILNAAENGILDLDAALNELCVSYRRAGVDLLISYFVPQLLDLLR